MSQTPQTDRDLLRRIERSAGHRAGYKQLVRELGLGGGHARRLLREQLGRLTGRKELVQIGADIWALPTAIPERTARPKPDTDLSPTHETRPTRDRLVAGRLDLHRDGYGFVRPNGSTSREDDLFIPPTELNGAMQGDEVLVDEAPLGRDGRHSGRILRILTRRNPTVVGIFHYATPPSTRQSALENDAVPLVARQLRHPLDERMTPAHPHPRRRVAESLLPPTLSNERRTAPSAKKPDEAAPGSPTRRQLRPKIAEPPPRRPRRRHRNHRLPLRPASPAKGRVLEVLGPPDAFGVDVEIVIRKHHLPHVFPANVLAEATDSAAQTVRISHPLPDTEGIQ